LQAKVAAFRTKKEVIKAQYGAAQAQVRIGEALSGISEEMGDVALAVERAENKTEHLRAKAGAIDELAASGVLEDFSGRQDDIGRELAQLTSSQNVEAELAALKASLPSGPTQGELPPGSPKRLSEGQS
jgi:phage shock protein A